MSSDTIRFRPKYPQNYGITFRRPSDVDLGFERIVTIGQFVFAPKRLQADIDVYVNSAASDANDGLTSGTAVKTIQHAFDLVANAYVLGGFKAHIHVADGDYSSENVAANVAGSGDTNTVTVLLDGDTATPSAVTIGSIAVNGARVLLQGVTVAGQASAAHNGVLFAQNSVLNSIKAFPAAQAYIGNAVSFAGNATYAFWADQGRIDIIDEVAFVGTPAYTATAFCDNGGIICTNGNVMTGTATGKRFAVQRNGVLASSGGGLNYLPGNAAGTISSGALYDDLAEHDLSAKLVPADTDYLPLTDSADGNKRKGLTWANVKSVLKSFFDPSYIAQTALDTDDTLAANSNSRVASQQATRAYVNSRIAELVDSSPVALDTLKELADALGDDPDFATTTATALGNRLRVDIGTQGLSAGQQANALANLGIEKDASGGYVGLTGFAINFKNALGTFLNKFVNATTAARTWTFPDKDGTVAMTSDILTDHAALSNIGTNSHAAIDTALTRLADTSGENTGDQDLSGLAHKPSYAAAADGVSITPALISGDTTRVHQTNTQAAGTLTLDNPTGAPVDGQVLRIRVTCTNAQALAFGDVYAFTNQLTQPTGTTGADKTDRMDFEYRAGSSKWELIGISFGA